MNDELIRELMRSETLLCKGLKEINDSGLMTPQTLDVIYKIADIVLDYSKVYKEDCYGARRRDSMGRYAEEDFDYRRR